MTKLAEEACVVGPEEADIRDGEEEHGEALDAEAPGPADAVADAGAVEDALLHDAAAEELEPGAVPVDFEFPGGAGEGEVGGGPAEEGRGGVVVGGGGLGEVEEFGDEVFEGAFEVGGEDTDFLVVVLGLFGVGAWVEGWVGVLGGDGAGTELFDGGSDALDARFVGFEHGEGEVLNWVPFRGAPESGALHLVENGEVAAVNAVAAEDVGADGVAGGGVGFSHGVEGGVLVDGGLGAEDLVLVDVVGVCSAAAGVVGGESEHVEIGAGADNGVGGRVMLVGGLVED